MAIDNDTGADKLTEKQKVAHQIIQQAVEGDVQSIYFNGFTNTIGVGDVLVVLQKNGKPVAVLNCSYTVAKTLAIKLGQGISFLEDKTNQKMLTTDQVEQCVSVEKKDDTTGE
jgi:predicted KAP-like P-loop ATPase